MTMVTHNENQTVTVPRLLLRQLCRLLLRLLAACPPASFAACSSASFAACSSAFFLALLGVGLQQGREQDCEPQQQPTQREQESRTDLRAGPALEEPLDLCEGQATNAAEHRVSKCSRKASQEKQPAHQRPADLP